MTPGREPRAEVGPEGGVTVRHLPFVLALGLRRLPDLLSDRAPGIRDRVCPSPFPREDPEAEEWARHAGPELRHLFTDAREVVTADLESLRREAGRPPTFRLEIPPGHLSAWLSALSAVRVALGEVHGVDAEDMARELPPELPTERDRALFTIHLLGWLQEILVRAAAPPE